MIRLPISQLCPDMTTHQHHNGAHDHAEHHHGHDHSHDEHAGHDHGSCSGHGHSHGFGHSHTHEPQNFGAAFAIGILLNTAYVGAEALWGVWAHSMSLLADAGHNLSDVLGLGAAWLAQHLAKRAPSARFTYGLRRSTILAALTNACILLLVTGAIVWEAVLRLFSHQAVEGNVVTWVALIGIAINGGTALLFLRGASSDLNIRGAFMHMAADAVMALAVVIAGLLISFTGYAIIDPIVSLIVSASIVLGTWSLLRGSLELALDAVPANIDSTLVEKTLLRLPGVGGLHHLHIWPMSTTETAMTVHLLHDTGSGISSDALIAEAGTVMRQKFGIAHPTFQVETGTSACDARAAGC